MKRDREKKKSHVCVAYYSRCFLVLPVSVNRLQGLLSKSCPSFPSSHCASSWQGFWKKKLGTFCMGKISRRCYSIHFYMYLFCHTWLICLMSLLSVKLGVMDGEDAVQQVEQTRQRWQTLLALLNLPLLWCLWTIAKKVKAAGSYCFCRPCLWEGWQETLVIRLLFTHTEWSLIVKGKNHMFYFI